MVLKKSINLPNIFTFTLETKLYDTHKVDFEGQFDFMNRDGLRCQFTAFEKKNQPEISDWKNEAE